MAPALILEARSETDFEVARSLFREYADALGIDLAFQDFAREVERIDEVYAPPAGCVLLADRGGIAVGCVGLRPLAPRICEMKRLYVRPPVRGLKVGRQLVVAIIERARGIGYDRIVLDTLVSLRVATRLYRSLGFREIAPYYSSPLPDVLYMELHLNEVQT